MIYITGLDFTKQTELFAHLQNRGDELLYSATRKLMKIYRFPFVLLITCDRAEVVSLAKASAEPLERALSLNVAAVSQYRYSLEGEEAEKHLFLLASGIISPLFGEDTIQGQMAASSEVARLSGSSSPQLNKLFNMAVAFSKELHSKRKIRVFDKSIAEEVAQRLENRKRILITGSGESARIVATRLLCDDHEIHIALRDESKTFLVPVGTAAVAYDDRMKEGEWAEAIISASSGLYHTFTKAECEALSPRPMYDLAYPYDLPSASNVIRISDLDVEEPEKEEVIAFVRAETEKAHRKYREWDDNSSEHLELERTAEELADEAMRRLSSRISSLTLSEEDEKRFRLSVMDAVKKAYITKHYEKQKK